MNVDAIKESYRRALGEFEPVFIRRYTGAGTNRPKFDAACAGRVVGYTPQELIGGIVQGDRKLIVFHDDLVTAGFPLPITTSDKAVVEGRELAIFAPDRSTRRVGGVTIAYELQVRG